MVLRKNSQSNRSDRGAVTQALLMSVYRTLRLRGHDPLQTIAEALRTYLQTGHLPPLPAASTADGGTGTYTQCSHLAAGLSRHSRVSRPRLAT